MEYGVLLLSKTIDEADYKGLKLSQVKRNDFGTKMEREMYDFINNYAEENGGNVPSLAVAVSEYPEFAHEYVPNVTDSQEYLVKRMKDNKAQRMLLDFFPELVDDFNGGASGESLLKKMRSSLERIESETAVETKIGTSVKDDLAKFREEYKRRSEGTSFKIIKSRFSAIGEYVSSNMYVVYGESGRGKSVVTQEDAVYAAMQGANVLIWSMEMGWYEVLTRIIVAISGVEGSLITEVNGLKLSGGFDSRGVRLGQLDDEMYDLFTDFLTRINDMIPGNIIVKSVDDPTFTDRSIRALERDIEAVSADYVVVDPFYYLHYEKNTSKTTGGDAASTSEALRSMAGRTSTVIIAITQADTKKVNEDADGFRELELPEREDVLKTKQLMQDAYLLIGVDTDYKQGLGIVGVNKGRDGGEGDVSEIIYLPNSGIVRERTTEIPQEFQFTVDF